jgi:hypothetical protein
VLRNSAGETSTLLDTTLEGIAARYGEPTADLVALGLEYRRRRSGQ